ncbi:MAG: hypothetical protein J6R42_02970 [Clostridia bacterium]|nr:hypothetical protein [Clostridia bacterium]
MIKKISQSEINQNKVASLPTRPNASTAFGGAGYSSAELRAAFDRLPLLIAARLNELIDSTSKAGENGLSAFMPTGLGKNENATLSDMFTHIKDGTFATYLKVGSSYLDLVLATLAPIFSPSFTGQPTAITPPLSDESGRLATTAWVKALHSDMIALYQSIIDGTFGVLPDGGAKGDVLVKSSDQNQHASWENIANFVFDRPQATTPLPDDNTQSVATTAFVQSALSALRSTLLDGVESRYDTLKEIVDALGDQDSDISRALEEIGKKDNKTTFLSFEDDTEILLSSHTEYRSTDPLSALSITFPSEPAEDFIASLEFNTNEDCDLVLDYSNAPYVCFTGDDTVEGTFIPLRGMHYTLVFWFS